MVGSLRIDCLGKDNSEIPVYGVREGEENLWKDAMIVDARVYWMSDEGIEADSRCPYGVRANRSGTIPRISSASADFILGYFPIVPPGQKIEPSKRKRRLTETGGALNVTDLDVADVGI